MALALVNELSVRDDGCVLAIDRLYHPRNGGYVSVSWERRDGTLEHEFGDGSFGIRAPFKVRSWPMKFIDIDREEEKILLQEIERILSDERRVKP